MHKVTRKHKKGIVYITITSPSGLSKTWSSSRNPHQDTWAQWLVLKTVRPKPKKYKDQLTQEDLEALYREATELLFESSRRTSLKELKHDIAELLST